MDGEYQTAEEAINHAKEVVLRSFSKRGKAGYEEWLLFGESASISTPEGASAVEFSDQDFVKNICGIREQNALIRLSKNPDYS